MSSTLGPKLIASFVALAIVAGGLGYYIGGLEHSGFSSSTQADSPGNAATHILQALARGHWSPASFAPYETTELKTWLSDPEHQKALSASLADIGALKGNGNIHVKEVRSESHDGSEVSSVVLMADFTKNTQFINLSMVKQKGSWKLNNLSAASEEQMFAEKTYITSAQILNQLSQNQWKADTLKQFSSQNLQNAQDQDKTKAALAALSALGSVQQVDQLLQFKYDGKTKVASVLMDVEFSKAHRPVLLILKLNNDHWELDGLSVMNYEAAAEKPAMNPAPDAIPKAE